MSPAAFDFLRGARTATFQTTAALPLIVVLALLICACGVKPPAQVSGTYSGYYFGGTETLILHPSGQFVQSFVTNGVGVYTNAGSWTRNGRDIRFHKLVKAYTFTDPTFFEFRMPLDTFEGTIPWGSEAIVFSGGGEYFVRKKPGSESQVKDR